MMRVLDLFSGIGGFSLGLERTGGFKTVAFCEIDKFCQRVLAKHWPGVPIYDDIKELTGARLAADGIAVDVICGGFPCQDLSFAGKRAGLEGARSGLWSEYGRLIGEVRPGFVIVENVPGLLSLGMGTVLGDLSALGYDAVWDCVPACAVGAPHRRDRVWLIAHPQHSDAHDAGSHHQNADAAGQELQVQSADEQGGELGQVRRALSDANRARLEGWDGEVLSERARERTARTSSPSMADTDGRDGHGRSGPLQMGRQRSEEEIKDDGFTARTQWCAEPSVGRVAHGIPDRVDQLRALGNAVVPQIPELIGRAILEACHD